MFLANKYEEKKIKKFPQVQLTGSGQDGGGDAGSEEEESHQKNQAKMHLIRTKLVFQSFSVMFDVVW